MCIIFSARFPDVPWYVSLLILAAGLMLLALFQYFREPVFMKDCMDAGYTQAQCEMQWKWGEGTVSTLAYWLRLFVWRLTKPAVCSYHHHTDQSMSCLWCQASIEQWERERPQKG